MPWRESHSQYHKMDINEAQVSLSLSIKHQACPTTLLLSRDNRKLQSYPTSELTSTVLFEFIISFSPTNNSPSSVMSGIEVGIILAIIGVIFAAPPALHSVTHSFMRLRRWWARRHMKKRAEDKSNFTNSSKGLNKQHIWRSFVGVKPKSPPNGGGGNGQTLPALSAIQSFLLLLVVIIILTSGCAFVAVGLLVFVHNTSPATCSQGLQHHSMINRNQFPQTGNEKKTMKETYCWGLRRLPPSSS
jgi:hypothetical protein